MILSQSTNIAKEIEEKYPFSVDKFRLGGPDNMSTPFFGLFRSDNRKVVGNAVRAGYTPHTTEDVVALAEAAVDAFRDDGNARLHCDWQDGHVITIEPSREYRENIYGTNDGIFPRLMIRAGYGSAFRATLGMYRDMCRNMAELKMVKGCSVKLRHTTGLTARLDELRSEFSSVVASWSGVTEAARRMEENRVNLVDFVREVYPLPEDASDRKVENFDKRAEAIFRRVRRESIETGRGDIGSDRMVSGWLAFNGVQGYEQHETPRQGDPSWFERVTAALGSKAVAKAEKLALAA